MILSPSQARKLADALLTGDEDDGDAPAWAPQGEDGRFGRYRVTRLVGHGGMGEVYEAQQDHPSRRVALKIVRPDYISPDLARRLDHEARILGRLHHAGIAQIFDAGQVETPRGRTPYFAMEFVQGRPLTRYARESNLAPRARLELFLQVCDAVEHAHRKGVIHRDLKPGNILVDAEGKPRVLDFGLARATDADVRATTVHTEIGKLVGTLPYMSPEQLSGDPDATDTRSDVYALGVVLYELLAGKPPYDIGRGPIAEAARIIRDTDPAPLSSIDRVFRGDLETIAAKALEKDKERRYQSVAALAADIRRHLGDEPIEARPAGAWYHLTRFARRNRAVFAAACVTAAVLVGATVVSLLFASHAAVARRAAEKASEEATRRMRDAQKQGATASEVTKFLQALLTSPEPSRHGPGFTVVDWLDVAGVQLFNSPVTDPAVRAALHNTFGVAFINLGLFEKAVPHLEAAVSLRREVYGAADQETINAVNNLATACSYTGEIARAEGLYEEVLGHTASNPESEPRFTLLYNYAAFLEDREEFARSEPIRRETVALATRLFGENDERTLGAISHLGSTLNSLGQHEEAGKMLLDVLERRRKAFGDDHPGTLHALQGLSMSMARAGRFADAEPLMRENVHRRAETYGAEDIHTLTSMQTLAWIVQKQDRPDEAEKLYLEVIDAGRRTLPEKSPELARWEYQYATLLMKLDRLSEAEPMLLAGARRIEAAAGPEDPRVITVARTVVTLYERLEQPDKAAEWRAKLPPEPSPEPPPAQPAPTPPAGGG